MSVQVERLEHNMAKLTVEVAAEDFVKAIENAYKKNRGQISIAGFRKGKAPLAIVERMYGKEIFYDDAANECLQNSYGDAVDESGLDVVSSPEISLVQIEKGKNFIYTAAVAVKPEVTLGAYKGLEVPKADLTVSDSEVEEALKKEQEKNSRLVDVEDRAVEDGDTVVLDYSGSVDGVAFDGGTAENQTLVIGSGSFIPGFEEQLIGVKPEEEKDVVVTFPEEYHAKELAGKEAVFKCTIHKIQKKELPELDDEFAQEVSEFETLDEYKEDLKKKLQESKEKQALEDKQQAAVSKLAELSEMDIPDAMIASRVDQMYRDQANRMQSQGFPMELYLKYLSTTEEALKEQMKPAARSRIESQLVLEAVAKAENIEISDQQIEDEMKKMAESYQMDVKTLMDAMGDYEKDAIRADLAAQEALKFLTDNAVEVEVKEEAAEEAAE